MNPPSAYLPSKLDPGEAEALRERAFTRWMFLDLLQAATEFCQNIGLVAVCCECSKEGTRYLFWQAPQDARFEIRSGRTEEEFLGFDRANRERGWPLLSLHVSEENLYSGVWVSEPHYESGVAYLRCYGISPADGKES